jgi:hypothetical protein
MMKPLSHYPTFSEVAVYIAAIPGMGWVQRWNVAEVVRKDPHITPVEGRILRQHVSTVLVDLVIQRANNARRGY